jgi:hypothetical protein
MFVPFTAVIISFTCKPALAAGLDGMIEGLEESLLGAMKAPLSTPRLYSSATSAVRGMYLTPK